MEAWGNLNVRTSLRLNCLKSPGIRCGLEKSLEAKLMGVQPDRDVDPLLILMSSPYLEGMNHMWVYKYSCVFIGSRAALFAAGLMRWLF